MVAGQRSALARGNRLFLGPHTMITNFYSQQFPFLFFNQYLQRQTHAGWIIYENCPWGGLKNRKQNSHQNGGKNQQSALSRIYIDGHVKYSNSCSLLPSNARMSCLKEQNRLQPLSPSMLSFHSLARSRFLLLHWLPIRFSKFSLPHPLSASSWCFHLLHIGHFIRIQTWSNEN